MAYFCHLFKYALYEYQIIKCLIFPQKVSGFSEISFGCSPNSNKFLLYFIIADIGYIYNRISYI